MKVTLIAHTPEPEKTVAAAARLCYSPSNIEALQNGLDDQKAADFVAMLTEMGHESPTEHASFTFGIEGVSVLFLLKSPVIASPLFQCRASDMSGRTLLNLLLLPL